MSSSASWACASWRLRTPKHPASRARTPVKKRDGRAELRGVDQISPPFRIAIVAMLAACALWFTVLRPKAPAVDAPLPTAPGATGLAHDVNAAKGAAAKSDAANKATEAATGGSSASTATATGGTAA